MLKILLFLLLLSSQVFALPLYWWSKPGTVNFGDALSPMIVEKMIEKNLEIPKKKGKNLLALGSILHFAKDDDVIWGSGVNGKISLSEYHFKKLDVRAVRGPRTRAFLQSLGIDCPAIYGDPALLLPKIFPHLKPTFEKDFIVIPNLNEISSYEQFPNVVVPTQEPMKVIEEILKAKFVISGSLHGIIVAEAFGIPARYLRITEKEHLLKYQDYYEGTNRADFKIAHSLEEALKLGGEKPPVFDINALFKAFPYDQFQ